MQVADGSGVLQVDDKFGRMSVGVDHCSWLIRNYRSMATQTSPKDMAVSACL